MPKKKKNTPDSALPEKPRETKKIAKKVFIVIGIFFILSFIGLIVYWIFDARYGNKFFPNVYIGDTKVAGKTYLEVLDQQDNIVQDFYNTGLIFSYQDNKATIPTTYIKDEAAGISVDILNIDSKATVDQAYKVGRGYNRLTSFMQRIRLLFIPKHQDIVYTLNNEELKSYLEKQFGQYENRAKNAKLTFNENSEIEVTSEKEGQAFNWEKIINELKNNVAVGENKKIYLNLETDYPKLKQSDTAALVQQTEELLALAPITLIWEDKTWEIDKETLQTWLIFSNNGLALDKDIVTTDLEEDISSEIDQAVKEGKFSLDIQSDNSVAIKQFQQGEDGRELKINKNIDLFQDKFINNNNTEIELIVEVVKPRVAPENIADLGIKELLGTGYTNFSGSPSNRIQNIKKGAEILNGILIAPGETFSLVTALGHIDGENGWLPELVIKENKTIPEFGGGLCQIGTTSFRAAMMSGLEIVERQNHSYVVSYYNYNGKPGVDATIYEPKPDFRFTNNTGHYILWRSRVEGYDIYFEFWGTADGRKGYFTDPTNYNYISAPPAQITEVDDLEPGVMECSEKAHSGVSAAFDYIIEWPDGHQDKQTFTSVYKALPQVCRKGKEKTEETKPDSNTNTNKSNNSNTNTATNTNKKKKQ